MPSVTDPCDLPQRPAPIPCRRLTFRCKSRRISTAACARRSSPPSKGNCGCNSCRSQRTVLRRNQKRTERLHPWRPRPRPSHRSHCLGLRRQLLSPDPQGRHPDQDRRRNSRAFCLQPRDAHPHDLSLRRHQPLGPGCLRRPAGRNRAQLARLAGGRRRQKDSPAARSHRRQRQPLTRSISRQDRPRSRFHLHLHAGRNSLQQLQRHVLRRRAERLSHARVHEIPAALGHVHRHLAAQRRRGIPCPRAATCPRRSRAESRDWKPIPRCASASAASTG